LNVNPARPRTETSGIHMAYDMKEYDRGWSHIFGLIESIAELRDQLVRK